MAPPPGSWTDPGRLFSPPSTADVVDFALLDATMVALLVWAVLRHRALARVFGGAGPRVFGGLVALSALQIALVWGLVPHAPWHTNMHGFYKLFEVEDAPWAAPPDLRQHGLAWYALFRGLVQLAPAGTLGLYSAMAGVSVAALWAFGGWLWQTTGRRDVTLFGVLLLVLTPAHLRLSASDSYFLPIELCVLGALVLWERHVREGARDLAVVAVLLVGLAGNMHLEMAVFAPMVLGVHAAVRSPETARRALRDPALWIALVWMGSTRGVDVLFGGSEAATPVVGETGWLGALRQYGLQMAPGALVFLGVAGVAWRGRARWSSPPGTLSATAATRILAAALVLPWLPGLRAHPYEGVDRWYALVPWQLLHFVLNLNYTPALHVVLFVVGVVWLARADVRTFTRLMAPATLMLVLYASQYDAVATYIRFGLSVQWAFVAVMAIAAGAVVSALPWRPAMAWGALTVAAAVGFVPYASWVGWEYPTQTDHRVLEAASGVDGPLYTLTPDDFPAGFRDGFRTDLQRYAATFLAARTGRGVASAHDLLDAPDDGTVRYWVRSANCYRAPVQARGEKWPFEILIGDRPVRAPGRRGPQAPPLVWGPARSWPEWEIDATLPCRHRTDEARCAESDGARCLAWVYPETCAGHPPPFVQPACAAVEAAWEMVPVYEAPVRGGRDSEIAWMLLDPNPTLGVYRMVRRAVAAPTIP